jgi:preprotein translocase subunit SecG
MSGILMGLITTLHILACVSLMVAILLQSGKGGGLAGTFGAGSSQTLFGGRGAATFLSRARRDLGGRVLPHFIDAESDLDPPGRRRRTKLITEEAKRRAGQGQRPAESNAPPPLGGATTPGQGLTPPAATQGAPPAATTPPATTAPAPKTSTAPAKKAPAAQPPAASPAEQAPATNAPSTNTTAPTPPANTTTQGGQ